MCVCDRLGESRWIIGVGREMRSLLASVWEHLTDFRRSANSVAQFGLVCLDPVTGHSWVPKKPQYQEQGREGDVHRMMCLLASPDCAAIPWLRPLTDALLSFLYVWGVKIDGRPELRFTEWRLLGQSTSGNWALAVCHSLCWKRGCVACILRAHGQGP